MPGEAGGDLAIRNANWIHLVLTDAGTFHALAETREASSLETTYYRELAHVDTTFATPLSEPLVDKSRSTIDAGFFNYSGATGSSIFVLANSVEVTLQDALGVLVGLESQSCTEALFSQNESQSGITERACFAEPQFALRSDGGQTISVRIEGVRKIAWHNVHGTCSAKSCPTGGVQEEKEIIHTSQLTIKQRTRSFETLSTNNGSLHIGGVGGTILVGGEKTNLFTDGWMRLPNFQTADCQVCGSPANQTLFAEGTIYLSNVSPLGARRLGGDLSGSAIIVRVDEQSIAPDFIFGKSGIAATAAAAGLVIVLKWLVAPFFTRLSKDQALEHPRRKAIFEYVQLHPGANFREIARNTGIAAGTVRHHLNVLGRSDIIVEHQHGSTVRLFENQARFQQNWADLVLLREPPLGQLHAWLKEHPASPQKAVLEGMDAHGWSRSTTQHRLARLVEGGLATIRLQGRLKIYSVVDRNAPPPPNLLQRPQPGVAGTSARPGFNTA